MHLLMQHLRWTWAINSAEFTQKNVELAVTVYPGMFTDTNSWRIQSTKPQRSWHLQLRKHGHCQLRRWDTYNWPRHFGRCGYFTTKKNQWTEHLVEYPVIAFRSDAANMNRLLNSAVIWRSFNDNNIFYFGHSFLVNFCTRCCTLCGNCHVHLYLFSRINYSCLASPFIQL